MRTSGGPEPPRWKGVKEPRILGLWQRRRWRTVLRMTFLNHRSRHLTAALIAALLGAAALLSVSPAPASASYGNCDHGDFCLYYLGNADPAGGIYHFGGSDSSLFNDRFERNHTNTIVANHAASAWNNGNPATKDDVIIYGPSGDACIRRMDKGLLPLDTWFDKVTSYKWATNAQCSAAGVINLVL